VLVLALTLGGYGFANIGRYLDERRSLRKRMPSPYWRARAWIARSRPLDLYSAASLDASS
jgi:hypothetical protein